MIETENKVYARRCESHVEALRRAVPGCIEKVEWQCEDQLTITVKQDKLPEAVHYLYYERYGWIPVIIGNDEAQSVRPLRRVLRHLHGGGGPRLGDRPRRGRSRQDDVPVRDALRSRCVWGERELRDMFRPDPRGPARPSPPGAAR